MEYDGTDNYEQLQGFQPDDFLEQEGFPHTYDIHLDGPDASRPGHLYLPDFTDSTDVSAAYTEITPLLPVPAEGPGYLAGEQAGETLDDDMYAGEYADYFNTRHATLKNDYKDAAGETPESCKRIALDIYKLMKANGETSRIMTLFGKDVHPDGTKAWLIPAVYEGRVKWASHVICVSDGVVYDPMLPKPLLMENYLATAFDQEVLAEDKLYL